jgi:hypothetical protein
MERRVQFETNVDDVVDANDRYCRRAPLFQAQRRRGIIGAAVVAAVLAFAIVWIFTGSHSRPVLPLAVLSLAVGGAFFPLYGRFYDDGFKRRLRRIVVEQAREQTSWLCEIELRKEGVWSRGQGIEVLFDWPELTLLEDTDAGILFHFRGGFVMARNRAFSTPAQRAQFLETARRLAPSGIGG